MAGGRKDELDVAGEGSMDLNVLWEFGVAREKYTRLALNQSALGVEETVTERVQQVCVGLGIGREYRSFVRYRSRDSKSFKFLDSTDSFAIYSSAIFTYF